MIRLGIAQRLSPQLDPLTRGYIPGLSYLDIFNIEDGEIFGRSVRFRPTKYETVDIQWHTTEEFDAAVIKGSALPSGAVTRLGVVSLILLLPDGRELPAVLELKLSGFRRSNSLTIRSILSMRETEDQVYLLKSVERKVATNLYGEWLVSEENGVGK